MHQSTHLLIHHRIHSISLADCDYIGSKRRKNVADPAAEKKEYVSKAGNKCVYLKESIPSETFRSGPIFDAVKRQLPDTTQVTYNRNLRCFPHRDSRNTGYSHICFLGDYDGGELLTEGGGVYSERNKWMGPMDLRSVTHWNNPVTRGTKHSLVAFTNPTTRFKCATTGAREEQEQCSC